MASDLSSYVESLTDFEKDPRGLRTDFEKRFRLFRSFVSAHKDPQDSFASIHIAGSKGKGSVGHILSALLGARFGKVGLFTSPHLLDVTERIRLNGRPIGRNLFLRYSERVKRLADRARVRLSYFEFLTFLSFLYFKDVRPDIVIYETGLGGRLDATNVLRPMASVLTLIEVEHADILGPTLEKIAAEKLGIMKRNVPVFSLAQEPSVRLLIRRRASELNCRIFEENHAFSASVGEITPRGCGFVFRDVIDNRGLVLHTPMANPVQARNISLALFMTRWMSVRSELKPEITAGNSVARRDSARRVAARRVVGNFSVPGRFEFISRDPVVIFDPCHTAASYEALLGALRRLYRMDKVVLYLSLFRDKDIKAILRLLRSAGLAEIVWLENPNPRSFSYEEALLHAPGLRSASLTGSGAVIGKLKKDRIHVFTGSFSIYRFIKIS